MGLVIRDQLRQVAFEPYRLWRPPLNSPHSIDDLVDAHLGRAWQSDYAAAGDLVFPVGLIDRVKPCREIVADLMAEYRAARTSLPAFEG